MAHFWCICKHSASHLKKTDQEKLQVLCLLKEFVGDPGDILKTVCSKKSWAQLWHVFWTSVSPVLILTKRCAFWHYLGRSLGDKQTLTGWNCRQIFPTCESVHKATDSTCWCADPDRLSVTAQTEQFIPWPSTHFRLLGIHTWPSQLAVSSVVKTLAKIIHEG